ncbi:filamentous hemagglutinin outer membrane protein [Caballeronia arationis]|uniref:two-partner secretion domain-containing protein n=1 Tax=Caballeronia arationis TaxID=1777142 RepID=UPI00074C3464|nr:filamentous hemagglutinin N-terminal domain-containing protein [Caballeronia arationis]SAL07540.1 filamentous hemagglutinin outer membrane protein [Caballeronia arationis]
MTRPRFPAFPACVARNAWCLRSTFKLLLAAAQVVGPTAAVAAGPLPDGGQFVAGAGSMTRNGATLNIRQATPQAVIDWKSFSVGIGHTVSIDNPKGATLNRITGPSIARIDGKLTGVGDVYVLDPHGVVIGKTGVVATGGRFVASTLDISNGDFMRYYPQVNLVGTSSGTVVEPPPIFLDTNLG